MKLLEKAKGLFKPKGGKTKAKYVKFTARDIQMNCIRIREAMSRTPVGTEEFEALERELKSEQEILKKYKDARFYIAPKDYAMIGGTTAAVIFFIALAREYPSALKVGAMLLKIMPFKGI